jgi:hypothetical protein
MLIYTVLFILVAIIGLAAAVIWAIRSPDRPQNELEANLMIMDEIKTARH